MEVMLSATEFFGVFFAIFNVMLKWKENAGQHSGKNKNRNRNEYFSFDRIIA